MSLAWEMSLPFQSLGLSTAEDLNLMLITINSQTEDLSNFGRPHAFNESGFGYSISPSVRIQFSNFDWYFKRFTNKFELIDWVIIWSHIISNKMRQKNQPQWCGYFDGYVVHIVYNDLQT